MRHWLGVAIVTLVATASAYGGIIGPGKHTGVVIYDRWDGCILYNGVFLNYISEKTKEDLRKHAGECVQLDVTNAFQPVNPGDALFSRFTYVGPAPASMSPPEEQVAKALRIESSLASKDGAAPVVKVEIINSGKDDLKFERLSLAPTVLTGNPRPELRGFIPADGPSFAAVTRNDVPLGDWSRAGRPERAVAKGYFWSSEVTMNGVPSKVRVRDDERLHGTLVLKPGEKLPVYLEFDLPPGEYDFLCGLTAGIDYGKCTASNLTAFDVDKDGKMKRVEVAGR